MPMKHSDNAANGHYQKFSTACLGQQTQVKMTRPLAPPELLKLIPFEDKIYRFNKVGEIAI